LRSGYRLIDTAQVYGVEPIVGDAIRASNIPRSEITLITKFPSQMHHDPAAALEQSLASFGPGVDYIDIFLMHSPCALTPDGKSPVALDPSRPPPYVETWKKMEKLDRQKCKSIGVSNFTQKTLETLLKEASVIPVVNQVELHAMNPCLKLVPYCEEKGIRVISWR
jgi:glycerol 2-dehydrogenase (NADP+)